MYTHPLGLKDAILTLKDRKAVDSNGLSSEIIKSSQDVVDWISVDLSCKIRNDGPFDPEDPPLQNQE